METTHKHELRNIREPALWYGCYSVATLMHVIDQNHLITLYLKAKKPCPLKSVRVYWCVCVSVCNGINC